MDTRNLSKTFVLIWILATTSAESVVDVQTPVPEPTTIYDVTVTNDDLNGDVVDAVTNVPDDGTESLNEVTQATDIVITTKTTNSVSDITKTDAVSGVTMKNDVIDITASTTDANDVTKKVIIDGDDDDEEDEDEASEGDGKGKAKNGWNYFGADDQWAWGAEAPVCDSGKRQSPINIDGVNTEYNAELGEAMFHYNKSDSDHVLIYNDGKKIGSKFFGNVLVSGAGLPGTYKVAGYHWHWGRQDYKGSEHLYSGRSFPLEVHMVTYSTRYKDITEAVTNGDSNALAVFGTMFQLTDEADPVLENYETVFDQIKQPDANNKVRLDGFNQADMMSPDHTKYFRYLGSLTTPGCQEKVIWTNFVVPRKIARSQKLLEKFRSVSAKTDTFFSVGDNFREVQPLNGRTVQRSFKDISKPIGCGLDSVYDVSSAASVGLSTLVMVASALVLHL